MSAPVLEAGFQALNVTALVTAAVFDVRSRRVPNVLTAALLFTGLLASALHMSAPSLLSGALGVLVGLAIWLPFWLMGLLGAGDVKFFAAACAWLGPSLAWRSSLGVALLGGAMAAAMMVRQKGVKATAEFGAFSASNPGVMVNQARSDTMTASARSFPYAVPMALMLAAAMFAPGWFQ
jgi:prepilin peptidase CpaA